MKVQGFGAITFVATLRNAFGDTTISGNEVVLPWENRRLMAVKIESTSECIPNSWHTIPGGKMSYVSLSADSNHAWGVQLDGKAYYKEVHNSTEWTFMADDVHQVTVSGSNDHVWGVRSTTKEAIYTEGTSGTWETIVGPGPTTWKYITVSPEGEHVFGIDTDGNIWHRAGYSGTWEAEPITHSFKQMTVTENAIEAYAVDVDDYIFYRHAVDTNGEWISIAGRLAYISVSADGSHIWATNFAHIIYYRKGKNGFWKSMLGRAKIIDVSGAGDHVLGVDRNDDVHYLTGYPGYLTKDYDAKEQVPGGLKRIAVSPNGNIVFGIDNDNNVWEKLNDPYKYWPWVRTTNTDFKELSVIANGDCLWAINGNGDVNFKPGKSLPWLRASGNLMQIATSGDGAHVWAVNDHHIIYYRSGKKHPSPYWRSMSGRARYISVSEDGSHVWSVNRNGDVFYRQGTNEHLEHIEGMKLLKVTVSADGKHVWGINLENAPVYRAGIKGKWIEVESEQKAKFVDISVSGDGGIVWSVGDNGDVYCRKC